MFSRDRKYISAYQTGAHFNMVIIITLIDWFEVLRPRQHY